MADNTQKTGQNQGDPCDEESLRQQVAALQASIAARRAAPSLGNAAGMMSDLIESQVRLRELVESVTTIQGESASLLERLQELRVVADGRSAELEAQRRTALFEHQAQLAEVDQLRTAVQQEIAARQSIEPQLDEVLRLIENQAEIHETLIAEQQALQQEISSKSFGNLESRWSESATKGPPGTQPNEQLYVPSRASFPNIPDWDAFIAAFNRDTASYVDNKQRRAYARFMQTNGIDSPPRNMQNFPTVGNTDARVEYMQSFVPDAEQFNVLPWAGVGALQDARQVGNHLFGLSPEQRIAYLQQYTQRVDRGPSSPLNDSVPLHEGYTPKGPPPQRRAPSPGFQTSFEEWGDAAGILEADAAPFDAFADPNASFSENCALPSGARGGAGTGGASRTARVDDVGATSGQGSAPAGGSPGVWGSVPAEGGGFSFGNLGQPGQGNSFGAGGGFSFGNLGQPGGNSFYNGAGGAVFDSPGQQAGSFGQQPGPGAFGTTCTLPRSSTPNRGGQPREPNPAEINSFDGRDGGDVSFNQNRNLNDSHPNFDDESWADDSILRLGAQLVREGKIKLTESDTEDSLLHMTKQMSQNGEISFLSTCKTPPPGPGASTPNSNEGAAAATGGLPNPNVSPVLPGTPNYNSFYTPRPIPVSPPQTLEYWLRMVQYKTPRQPYEALYRSPIRPPPAPRADTTFGTNDTALSIESLSINEAFARVLAEDPNLSHPRPIPYQAPTPPYVPPPPLRGPAFVPSGRTYRDRPMTWVNPPGRAVERISPSYRPPNSAERAQQRAEEIERLNAETDGEYGRVWAQPPPPTERPDDSLSDLDNVFVPVTGHESFYRVLHEFETNPNPNQPRPYPYYRTMPIAEADALNAQQRIQDFIDYNAGNQVYRPLDHVQAYYDRYNERVRQVEEHYEMRRKLQEVPPEERDEVWEKQWVIYGDEPILYYGKRDMYAQPPPPPPRPPTPVRYNPPPQTPFTIENWTNVNAYLTNNPLDTSGAGLSSVSAPEMCPSPVYSPPRSLNLSGTGLSFVSTPPGLYQSSSEPFTPNKSGLSGSGLDAMTTPEMYQSSPDNGSVNMSPPPSPPPPAKSPEKTPEASKADSPKDSGPAGAGQQTPDPAPVCTPPPGVFGPVRQEPPAAPMTEGRFFQRNFRPVPSMSPGPRQLPMQGSPPTASCSLPTQNGFANFRQLNRFEPSPNSSSSSDGSRDRTPPPPPADYWEDFAPPQRFFERRSPRDGPVAQTPRPGYFLHTMGRNMSPIEAPDFREDFVDLVTPGRPQPQAGSPPQPGYFLNQQRNMSPIPAPDFREDYVDLVTPLRPPPQARPSPTPGFFMNQQRNMSPIPAPDFGDDYHIVATPSPPQAQAGPSCAMPQPPTPGFFMNQQRNMSPIPAPDFGDDFVIIEAPRAPARQPRPDPTPRPPPPRYHGRPGQGDEKKACVIM